MHLILITTLLLFQTHPPIRDPNVPRTDKPPGTGNTLPPNGNQLPNGNQQTTGPNVMVDGMYTILAYEKFGQALPGMTNLKVVIRNNIMTFPGDTKTPGKMLQLSFGPGNTITVTPLDGRGPNPWQQPPVNQTGANTAVGQTGTVNQTGSNNPTGQSNTNNQAGGQPPVIPPINNQTGTGAGQNNIMAPPANSESGVYVLSSEFFSISIVSQINRRFRTLMGRSSRTRILAEQSIRTRILRQATTSHPATIKMQERIIQTARVRSLLLAIQRLLPARPSWFSGELLINCFNSLYV